jgi:hypothetical protein
MYKKRLRWSTCAARVNISWRTDARRARLLFGAWRQVSVTVVTCVSRGRRKRGMTSLGVAGVDSEEPEMTLSREDMVDTGELLGRILARLHNST